MKTIKLAVVAAASLGTAGIAAADDAVPSAYSYAWHDSSLKSDFGISAILGGGITGFTDKSMRNTTGNVGGLWDLRVTIGSHLPLALELGYVGTAANIDAIGANRTATLLGTTAEGAIRYNVLPHFKWDPYAFVGIGWQRYDVTGATFTQADTGIKDSDNSVVYPMGAGLAYRDRSGLVLDVHGTFRANTNYGLVLNSIGSTSYAPMHTWEASGALGYEF